MDKNKITQFRLTAIIIVTMLPFISNVRAQGTCTNSLNLNAGQTYDTSYVINDSVLWLQFEAYNQNIELYVNSSNGSISELELYSGTCNALNSLQQVYDTVIIYNTLTVGEDYYLKVVLNQSQQDTVSVSCNLICVARAILTVYPNPVCVGDIVTFDTYGSILCNGHYAVWDWGGFQGTLISASPTYIYQATVAGNFDVTFYIAFDTIGNGIIDTVFADSATVHLVVLDSLPRMYVPEEVVCVGDTAFFYDSTICPVATSWNWTFGDGGSSFLRNPFHIYSQTGTYTVSLQTFPGGNTNSETIEVTQAVVPIIKGYQNNCDSTVTYSIENLDTNYTYTWSTQTFIQLTSQYTTGQFIINGNTNVETANIANIDWYSAAFPDLPDYVVITVEAHLNGSNCSASSTMIVYDCCEGDMGDGGLYWHDTTITDAHFINGRNIAINGTVTLKDSLVISNTSLSGGGIFFGPYAKLVLDTGAYFEINDGNLRNACEYMWDGIYTNSINETIKINTSVVENSINGLVSSNGGTLLLDSIEFVDNLIGVQLLNYKSVLLMPPPPFTPANISITNCTFNNQYTSNLNLQYYPYYNKQSVVGIKVSNMEDIIIGDTLMGGNSFYKMKNGIRIYNSKVSIYNNYFSDIKDIMSSSYKLRNGAVFIESSGIFDVANISEVQIGDLISSQNMFDSCYYSIISSNSKLMVENNIIKNSNMGITVYNFKNGTKIENNRFKDVIFGISINNLLGGNRKLDIDNNYFGGQADSSYTTISRQAINIINCNSQANSSIKTQIANNTINYSGPKSTITSGVRIQNCNGIMVNSNHIARTQISSSNINNDWDVTIGIRVAASEGATITDNYVWGFGQSITTYGNLNGTQFSCNELKLHKFGFYWDASTALSDQGVYNLRNTHNEWATVGSVTDNMKLDTSMAANIVNQSNINWYYFSNFGNQWIPNEVIFALPYKIDVISNDSATHLCVGGSGSGGNGGSGTGTGGGSPTGGSSAVLSLMDNIEDPEIRDFLFEDILEGEQYIDLQNEYRAYDANWLYDMLLEDTMMMWLGGALDTDYQQFFDSIRMSNIGDFTKVYDLIEAGNYAEAKTINNAIVPEQDIFVNLQTVLNIYLDSWCIERYDLSQLEYETLFDIANQTPYESGDAVYTARIMIGYEPDEYGVAYRLHKQDEVADEREELFLYPNPASDMVTIEFSNDALENVNAQLKVYTITGRLIYETQFNTNNSFKVLSVDMLKNGVYIYRISLSNGIDKSGKLVILKQ